MCTGLFGFSLWDLNPAFTFDDFFISQIISCIFTVMPLLAVEYMLDFPHEKISDSYMYSYFHEYPRTK